MENFLDLQMPPHEDDYWMKAIDEYRDFLDSVGLMEYVENDFDTDEELDEESEVRFIDELDFAQWDSDDDDNVPVGMLRDSDTEEEWETDDDDDLPDLQDVVDRYFLNRNN